MCIVAIAHGVSRHHRLVLAANRDERHARASLAADWWDDAPDVLGGRDLVAGGSWLGVARSGRVAAVTNVFEGPPAPAPRSRGDLVAGFLTGADSLTDYVARVADQADQYGPFNLLLYETARAAHGEAHRETDGEADRLFLVSNRNSTMQLQAGVHAYSNNRPGEVWPKVAAVGDRLAGTLDDPDPTPALFALLSSDRSPAPTGDVPGSIFIVGPTFGTRCSTVLVIDRDGHATYAERQFDPAGQPTGTASFEFALESATGAVRSAT
jgi:uncharacterized protein with NRDE domain